MRSVGASGALLALEPRNGSTPKVYSEGLTDAEADAIAGDLLAGSAPGDATAVEVVSARRRYGVLAIGGHGGLFSSQSENTLATYGRLAAATLDAADAMDEARHRPTRRRHSWICPPRCPSSSVPPRWRQRWRAPSLS